MNKELKEAIDKVTIDVLNSLEHGQEVELNKTYTLYHYCEDDVIVISKTEEWEEVIQVLHDGDKEIILESLI